MDETERIWHELHDQLRLFIARRLANEADVDDVLQEVFLRLQLSLDTLQRSDRLVAWLYQITRNAIADYYRAPGRRREVTAGSAAEMEEEHLAVAPEAALDHEPAKVRREMATCLRPMLEGLPASYREALVLVELEGLTQQAAAERLGLSVSGMKSRVQRGRRKLEAVLRDCCRIHVDARRAVTGYEARDGSCDPCATTPGACTSS